MFAHSLEAAAGDVNLLEVKSHQLQCDICKQIFSHQHLLNRHVKKHTRPYVCEVPTCRRNFTLKVDLIRHKRSVHDIQGGEEKLHCDVIGCKYNRDGSKWFVRKDHLVRHIRTHEPPTKHQTNQTSSTSASSATADLLSSPVEIGHGSGRNTIHMNEEFTDGNGMATSSRGIGDRVDGGLYLGAQTDQSTYHLERPETPPTPSSTVPFRRDPDFVNRGTLLNQIGERCSGPASRVALVGLGGVGKSQLAIEYCYQIRDQSPETWVFWVHASNAARLEQSYRDIADRVRLPGLKDPQADIFELVHNWLRNEKNGKWLLVLDNADDFAVLFKSPTSNRKALGSGWDDRVTHQLSIYLPQSNNGSVLVTTRTRDVASKLVEESDIIIVKPMDNRDALALLEKKLGEQMDKDSTAELAAALEFMPLALTQAAAYIRQRAPRCSVRQYLEGFHKSDKGRTILLSYEAGHLRRDQEAINSILITWQISFDHIYQSRPSAADLLSLMSFFDPQGIPESLLKKQDKLGSRDTGEGARDTGDSTYTNNDEDTVSECSINYEFEDDIATLQNYSFITVSKDGRTFEMHRLVQLSTRKWLQAHGQLERWKQQYIKNLSTAFPVGEHKNWIICQELFSHARSAEAQRPVAESSLREWASILHNAAWYAWAMGIYVEAERMSAEAARSREKVLGREHAETLGSIRLLALTYKDQGRWKEAEKLNLHVMEMSARVLGSEHPDTLTSMANLASTYRNQGRWKEAEELEVQAMEARKRVLGPEHPDTLTSMANLASTFWNQGRWKEAEELEVQVMEARECVLGPEHPDTLTSMANLASTVWNQGRWKEAEELEVQVMEARKRVLGPEHPDTLTSMANLASTFWNQGRWKEAEELEVQAVGTSARMLGPEHPDTLTSMANLALTYKNQGRWKEAEELNVQVMETSLRVLGPEHPGTLTCMANLALTYRNQGRWKEADELNVQVMETRKRVLGPEHPDALTSIANLASTYRNQGRWKEADELNVQVVEARKRVLGPEHPDTLTSMANLALMYRNQGRCKEAEELNMQVMETRKRVLGAEHPSTLRSMKSLASTYKDQGRWNEAEELSLHVMEMSARLLGREHPDTLTSMANLASTYRSQGRWDAAEELEGQVMETSSRVLGVGHPSTLRSMKNLASTYKDQGRWKEAEELNLHVMEMSAKVLGR